MSAPETKTISGKVSMEIAKKVRIYCAEHDLSVGKFIAELIEAKLTTPETLAG